MKPKLRVLVLCQFYYPEVSAAAAVFVRQLCESLIQKGHESTVATAFPNYPERIIHEAYRGKWFQTEHLDGVRILRSYIYANPDPGTKSRLLNWGSYCASTFLGSLVRAKRPSVIYAILPPLPLGVVALWLGTLKRAPVVTVIQDIYPDAAIKLGYMKNPRIIRFFKAMEAKIYRKSKHLIVISNGFRDNLIAKGVPPEKISVIRNWADPDFIQPGPKDNAFRRELGAKPDDFVVLYSGGLSNNSDVMPLVRAAHILRDEPGIRFGIVGDGVRKGELEAEAQQLGLTNLVFLPFQPLERYPEALRSCDLSVVTLNAEASGVSVPSKIFKQMAAGRAILAIADPETELGLMVGEAQNGVCVPAGDPEAAASAIRKLAYDRATCDAMGANSRKYLVEQCDMNKCIDEIESVLLAAAA